MDILRFILNQIIKSRFTDQKISSLGVLAQIEAAEFRGDGAAVPRHINARRTLAVRLIGNHIDLVGYIIQAEVIA